MPQRAMLLCSSQDYLRLHMLAATRYMLPTEVLLTLTHSHTHTHTLKILHAYSYMYIHIHSPPHTHTHTQHTHTHMHTHTHTYTHTTHPSIKGQHKCRMVGKVCWTGPSSRHQQIFCRLCKHCQWLLRLKWSFLPQPPHRKGVCNDFPAHHR